MDSVPKCYGRYGEGDCASCDAREWCVDAHDPTPVGGIGHGRSYAKIFEGSHCVDEAVISESSELGGLLGELFVSMDSTKAAMLYEFFSCMSALAKKHRTVYECVRAKVSRPHETYADISSRVGVSRERVCVALQEAVELLPVLRASIPPSNERLSEPKVVFEARCHGGNLYVLVNGEEALKLPNEELNSKNLLAFVAALNKMHWRKKDALVEEVEQ